MRDWLFALSIRNNYECYNLPTLLSFFFLKMSDEFNKKQTDMNIIKKFLVFFAFALIVLDAKAQNIIAVQGKDGITRIKEMPDAILHFDYSKAINFYIVPSGTTSTSYTGKMVVKLFPSVKKSIMFMVESEIGVCLSQISYPSVSDKTYTVQKITYLARYREFGYNDYVYDFSIKELKPNTKYYIRPYLTIGSKTWYGEPGTFTTKAE